MMPLYLRSLEASDFRPFAPGFNLRFEGPGITLLVGPNGLGKSSVFDAIEWALTDQVLRLNSLYKELSERAATGTYYARRSSQGQAPTFRVSLGFQDGDDSVTLERACNRIEGSRLACAASHSPQEIISLLRSPEWPLAIDPLDSYLWQTHFLGQGTLGRLASLPPDQRWTRLQGPAGLQLLNQVLASLAAPTTKAFGRAIAQREQQVELAQQKLEAWTQQLARRNHAREQARSLGALSEDETQRLETQVYQELCRQFPSLFDLAEAPKGPLPFLSLFQYLQRAREWIAERSQALTQLESVPERWLSAETQRELTDRLLTSLEEKLLILEQSIEQNRDALSQAQSELTSAQRRVEEAQSALEMLQNALDALSQRPHAQANLQKASDRLKDAKALKAQTQSQLELVTQSLEQAKASHARRSQASERISVLEQAQKQCRALIALQGELTAFGPDNHAFEMQRQSIDESLKSWETAIRRQQASLSASEKTLEQIVAQSKALEQAQALIASHLSEKDQSCPICQSLFAPGELKQRAEALALLTHPALSLAQKAKDEQLKALQLLQESQAKALSERDFFEKTYSRFQRLKARCSLQEKDLLLLVPDLAPMGSEQRLAYLSSEIERLRPRLFEPSLDMLQAQSRYQVAEQAFKDASDSLTQTQRQFDSAQEHASQIERAVRYLGKDPSLYPSAQEQEELLSQAQQTLAQAQEQAQQALTIHKQIEKQLDSWALTRAQQSEEVARLRSQLDVAKEQLRLLEQSWLGLSLPLPISESSLERARQELLPQSMSVERLTARLSSVQQSIEQSFAVQKEQQLIAQMLSETEASSEESLSAQLEEQLAQAEDEAQRARQAMALAQSLARELREEASDYRRRLVAPINALADQYHQALSPFFERQIELLPKPVRGGGTSLRLSLNWNRQPSASEQENASATHLLSEGQLSEVSLSLLLAMSTGFRWSRWPALLLDDPLQANDRQHALALADVLRNLVRDQAYQVLISTHDEALGTWLGQKFRAGKVPLRVYRFEEPGRAVLEQ